MKEIAELLLLLLLLLLLFAGRDFWLVDALPQFSPYFPIAPIVPSNAAFSQDRGRFDESVVGVPIVKGKV